MSRSPRWWLWWVLVIGLGACSPPPEGTDGGTLSDHSNATSLPDASSVPPIQHLDPPAGSGAMAPRLAAGRDGTALLSWIEPTADGHRLRFARLDGTTWSEPATIADGPNFFANWADTPGVSVLGDGWVVAWPEMLAEGTYAYGLSMAHGVETVGGGSKFQRAGMLHDDRTPEEHGFVSFVPRPDGGVRGFWLDGRELDSRSGGHSGEMQLRTTIVRSTPDGVVAEASDMLDGRVCECCSTDAAVTTDGPIVAYRDRDENEVRDIYVMRATPGADGELSWSRPLRVHADGWRIEGCPVNGPALAADGDAVAIAWFTAAEGPRVAAAWSMDGGVSFGAPTEIDASGSALGRVDLALDPAGNAWVTWLAVGSAGPAIQMRRVDRAGRAGSVRAVAATTERRASGVPRSLAQPERLVLTWVDDLQPSVVRVAVVPWS